MKYYSNEIVFRGHPDKICDQISDALLTEYLKGDPNSRCGIEVAGGKSIIFITGEVTSAAYVNVEKIVKSILFNIGYDPSKYTIINNIGRQSQDIALGTNDDVGGAGDQGMMFGYACNDTEFYVPVAMHILQELSIWYNDIVHNDEDFLPDGKAQITGVYDDDFKLVKIKDFTISYQNRETNRKRTDKIVRDKILELCDGYEIENFHINPTGKFLVGGFDGDAGLTGRKIVVDSYQSFSNVGGGCYSGKDCTKVDRSGAYKARQLAIRMLKKYNLKWCEVQVSYAIGIANPLAIYVDSNIGNITVDDKVYDEFKPANIIKEFDLKHFDFTKTSMYGHFGTGNFPWECV